MDVKNYINECYDILTEIKNEYNSIFISIYNIIPNNWRKNTLNDYNKKINNLRLNIKVELNNLVQVFPEKLDFQMEILEFKELQDSNNVNSETEKKDVEDCVNKIQELVSKYNEFAINRAKELNLICNIEDEIISTKGRLDNINTRIIGIVKEDYNTYLSEKNEYENVKDKSMAVIIPAYNAKETIRRAVNSVAEQSILDHIQVKTYIVNDCSEYNYQDIVSEYNSFLNIEEIELKRNVGPGIARQNGIRKSMEDFIIFLDGDDFFYNNKAFEILFKTIIRSEADCVASYFKEEGDGGRYRLSNNMGWLHGKLYSNLFLKSHNVEFIDSRATEDAAFNMLFQVNNPKIEYISDVTYVWANNKASITRKNNYEFSYNFIESYSENIRRILEIANERNLNMHIAMSNTLNALFVIWINYITFDNEQKKCQVLKWSKGLKNAYDKYKSEYVSKELMNDLFTARKDQYNPKWTLAFAQECFNNFLKKVDSYDDSVKDIIVTKKKMNILISMDEEYTSQAINMLNSILLNNNVFLEVYLLYNKLSIVSINVIKDFIELNGRGKLHEYYIDANIYEFPHTIQYIPDVTYYRLFAPFIIKENVDRMLYLDCDVIVTGSLEELYETNLETNILAGCKNMLCKEMSHLNNQFNTNLGLPLSNDYINAGVILIDIAKYRAYVTPEMILDFISANKHKLQMQDQDVINKLFFEKIKIVRNQYNFQINTVEENFVDDDIRIVHYSQRSKPWHSDYYSPKKAKYYYNFLAQKGDVRALNEIVGLHMNTMKNKIITETLRNN